MSTHISAVTLADSARSDLVSQLRENALIQGDVTLSSGALAKYLIDVKQLFLTPSGFRVLTQLVARFIRKWDATAVGGLTLGAEGLVFPAIASGEHVHGFIVRKERKQHGLQRLVEGPPLTTSDRCLIVDDVVTTGASTVKAIEAVRAEGPHICGVLSVLDRLAGGGERIEAAAGAPYVALTTIDDIYPDRPDR